MADDLCSVDREAFHQSVYQYKSVPCHLRGVFAWKEGAANDFLPHFGLHVEIGIVEMSVDTRIPAPFPASY